ncbi:MAG: hypothetical protein V4593_08085 [Pseudomonadota bacterium]
MTIERLTPYQRQWLAGDPPEGTAALRIIDAQAEEIERLRAVRHDDLDECERLAARCAELEAELQHVKECFPYHFTKAIERIDAAEARLAEPAAPTRTVYEVWVGTEKVKKRVVKQTADIEDAARTACADLSGCTFWGIKAPARTEAETCECGKPDCPYPTAVQAARTEAEHVAGCRYEKEYPAIDPEDCPRCSRVRTEVEQAVLDAMTEVPRSTVVNYATDTSATFRESSWHLPAVAELARRGLKS